MLRARTQTIALLIDWIDSAYHLAILQGVLDAAREAAVNVTCFTSGLRSGGATATWAVHRFIGPESFDGLIVVASAVATQTKAERESLLRCFRRLPLCSVGIELHEASSVRVDNEVGLGGAVDHLVQTHSCRRVGFVGGPEDNIEAQQRLDGYRTALAGHGLAVDERLILPGDFTVPAGGSAVQTLFDVRRVPLSEVDALVVANDGMAWGCLAALASRGIEVPRQLAITGFDDIPAARQSSVPLTTVRQPVAELGRRAVGLLLRRIEGAERERVVLPTELVTRGSCGCLEGIGRLPLTGADLQRRGGRGFHLALMERQETLLAELRRASHGQLDALGGGWEVRLLSALVDELNGRSADSFRKELTGALGRVSAARGDLTAFHEVVSVLWRHLTPCVLAEPALRTVMEGLLDGARLNIATAALRVQSGEQHASDALARELADVCINLMTSSSLRDVAAVIEKRFRHIGISRLAVALYPDKQAGSTLWRVLSFDSSRVRLERTELRRRELPAKILPNSGRSELIVSALHARENVFGVLCLELEPPSELVHNAIRDAMSAVLHRLGQLPIELPPSDPTVRGR